MGFAGTLPSLTESLLHRRYPTTSRNETPGGGVRGATFWTRRPPPLLPTVKPPQGGHFKTIRRKTHAKRKTYDIESTPALSLDPEQE